MNTETSNTVELTVGQPLTYPAAPAGIAQIEDLHRTWCTVVYLRKGRVCRRRIRAAAIAALLRDQPLLFQDRNPLGRGALKRTKTFHV